MAFNVPMSTVLEVELAERAYPIHILPDCAESVREAVAALRGENRRCALLVDAAVAEAQADRLRRAFSDVPALELPGGETTKSLTSLARAYDFLADTGVDRSGVLFVAGGGVIGDLGGFAAATYLRGIEFFQVPTTLLAMVDSSVGGKTGINIPAGKNLVGAFHQPKGVFIGTAFLETLPEREYNAGMAEIIKYGLLADAELFEHLRTCGPTQTAPEGLPDIIARCCRIKADIVRADEREQAASGGRALLNLGHTFAHAVERTAGYGEYLHGEAVGLGLVMAADLSRELGHLSADDVEAVRALVRVYDLPDTLRSPLPADDLLAAMKRDKKVRGGRLRFVALERIGSAVTVDDVEPATIAAIWKRYGAA